MCGIVGKLNFASGRPVIRSEIERMLRPIHHRGPDAQGVFLNAEVGLGHARLSIIDLSGGGQPMSNEDETVWIVFNGEIYNFQELRTRLVAKGHIFRSQSDTEVIIHLYEEHGVDCVKLLRGMFAFAIWDSSRKRLFIARDRVGIKPLYFCRTGQAFLFASELKAIITDEAVGREFNPAALRRFLSFYYLPGEDTLFKSIHKLLPGHTLIVENGEVRVQRYWDLKFTQDRYGKTFEEVVEELQHLLRSTVRDHMIADVPVGLLLSGGVDSSAILSFAVEETRKQIKTFTVGFDGGGVVDERPYARMAAERFGTEHHEITITAEDFWNFLPSYVWHMEEPVCEPPAVALYYVSKFASQHVKVLLSGEGGDEAFAGYPNYPNMLRAQKIGAALGPFANIAGRAAGLFGDLIGRGGLARYGQALGAPLAECYFSRTSGPTSPFNRRMKDLLVLDVYESTEAESPSRFIRNILAGSSEDDLLNRMLYIDSKTWLPDDLLVKADKMTMANSTELRVPLLDHKVLEFAASLPGHYKTEGRETKRALKAAFAKVLPAEVISRKKAGFPVPYERWLSQDLRLRVEDLLLSQAAKSSQYFKREEVEKLLRRNAADGGESKQVFSLLATELWLRSFLVRGMPAPLGLSNLFR